jgi:hypothetical protein
MRKCAEQQTAAQALCMMAMWKVAKDENGTADRH